MEICGRDIEIRGGPIRIARLAADGFEFVNDPKSVLEALGNCGERIDLFSFTQELPDATPKHDYPMEWDNIAALPVSTFDDWWDHQINAKTRNMVRRSQKLGVVAREVSFDDALLRGISAIYNESPIRQGKPFRHYQQDLESLRAEHSTFLERSVFIGAFLDDELIGFIKLVPANRQAGLMQIVSMIRHRDKAATNALIAEAVCSCANRSIQYLVYAKFDHGKNQRDTLGEFKKHNGFQRIEMPRYYVPLTAVGRAAIRLGLHRSFTDRIPESILGKLRDIRNSWYQRRFQTTT